MSVVRTRHGSLNLPRFSSPLSLPPIAEEEEPPPHVPVPYIVTDPRRSLDLGTVNPILHGPLLQTHSKSSSFPSKSLRRSRPFVLSELPPLEVRISSLQELKESRIQLASFIDFGGPDSEESESEDEIFPTPVITYHAPIFRSTAKDRPLVDSPPPLATPERPTCATRPSPLAVTLPPPKPPTDVRTILVQMKAHSRAVSVSQSQNGDSRVSIGADKFNFAVPPPTRPLRTQPRPRRPSTITTSSTRQSSPSVVTDRTTVTRYSDASGGSGNTTLVGGQGGERWRGDDAIGGEGGYPYLRLPLWKPSNSVADSIPSVSLVSSTILEERSSFHKLYLDLEGG
ncbi:hypothetical protein CC1G_09085 [Coprinopsis cinerea okayama7|uniref:Uncharacterized protein n=1 Tax=Coprinopsis cinerea (strain Okayama-7 / 130 / ATCC MYA-4618 / FGSC 9003) TaxID=240176 RepID=A8P329_COPC7|nr:hypothetical protein CC1G_09085 [Coprinopsis cinerea okayama7\|eukprot:XP_001838457.2 hypothetical protein CC1G_09085 [Coprinopsis cinerea okayama7\